MTTKRWILVVLVAIILLGGAGLATYVDLGLGNKTLPWVIDLIFGGLAALLFMKYWNKP